MRRKKKFNKVISLGGVMCTYDEWYQKKRTHIEDKITKIMGLRKYRIVQKYSSKDRISLSDLQRILELRKSYKKVKISSGTVYYKPDECIGAQVYIHLNGSAEKDIVFKFNWWHEM